MTRNHNLLTPRKPSAPQEKVALGPLIEGTEVAILEEVPSLKRNFDVLPPLACPQSQILVGGRSAYFASNWLDKWALSSVERGYKIPFKEIPPLLKDPNFFQQIKSQNWKKRSSVSSKREKILPESPGDYSRVFLVLKKNEKNEAHERSFHSKQICSNTKLQTGNSAKSQKFNSSRRLGILMDWI